MSDLEAVLDSVAALGSFFAVDTSPDTATNPLWRPLTELYGRALPDQVATARIRLSDCEPRVAASLLFQGIAARLWSPMLAMAAEGITLDLDPSLVFWRAASPGPVLLAMPSPAPSTGTLHDEVVTRNLVPLVAVVRSVTQVAEGLLWGNAASALAGSLATLRYGRPAGRATGLPEAAGSPRAAWMLRAAELVNELLATEPLRDALVPETLQRRSCCLYYRLPGAGKCGDCSLL